MVVPSLKAFNIISISVDFPWRESPIPVLVVADLHLDIWLGAKRDPLATIEPDVWGSLDALIVAGDLSNKPKTRWAPLIRHLGLYIAPERIHLFPGNHDYYDHILDGDDRLAKICADAGANFVQESEIVIGDTRFVCCTLWTDFALHGDPANAMRTAQADMNDYRYIRLAGAGYRRIRPSDTALVHTGHRRWIEQRLAMPFPGRTVVVTHHCPHPDLISATNNPTSPAYGSDLSGVIETYQPEAWLFGHTHQNLEEAVGLTTVRNISLGYPGDVRPGDEAAILLRGLIEAVSFPGELK